MISAILTTEVMIDLKPITIAYMAENLKWNRLKVSRWVKAGKIKTDPETGKILFTELIRLKANA